VEDGDDLTQHFIRLTAVAHDLVDRLERAGRPAAGADASPERSESKEAARPPVVLETVGRRSFGALSP